jgi:hypothetical protein
MAKSVFRRFPGSDLESDDNWENDEPPFWVQDRAGLNTRSILYEFFETATGSQSLFGSLTLGRVSALNRAGLSAVTGEVSAQRTMAILDVGKATINSAFSGSRVIGLSDIGKAITLGSRTLSLVRSLADTAKGMAYGSAQAQIHLAETQAGLVSALSQLSALSRSMSLSELSKAQVQVTRILSCVLGLSELSLVAGNATALLSLVRHVPLSGYSSTYGTASVMHRSLSQSLVSLADGLPSHVLSRGIALEPSGKTAGLNSLPLSHTRAMLRAGASLVGGTVVVSRVLDLDTASQAIAQSIVAALRYLSESQTATGAGSSPLTLIRNLVIAATGSESLLFSMSVSLASSFSIEEQTHVAANGAVIFQIQMAEALQGTVGIDPSISLSRIETLAVLANAITAAGISLSDVQSVTLNGQLAIVVATPSERVSIISAEERVSTVPVESRVFVVPAESRTLYV